MNIDAHSHFLPVTVVDYMKKHGTELQLAISEENGGLWMSYGGLKFPIAPGIMDNAVKLEDMKAMNIQKTVLSVAPMCFFYWIDSLACSLDVAQLCNDWVSDAVKKDPEHFSGMATVPMQEPKEALKELRRAHEQLGLKAVEIAPIIRGMQLDNEGFFPIYEYCADKGILVYLHPQVTEKREEYSQYYNTNLIGNILETNIGINHLLFGGVFEKYPALKVLASHGGGYFPYQLGRLMHGYEVRKEPKAKGAKSPENYVKNLYFDTITHWTPSLQFLIDTYGADHIVLGTDYPYDMGDLTPMDSLDKIKLTTEQRELICHGNIERLLG